MSKEKRRVPKLRFPGFTEDWEQRKLDNIAKIKTGGGTPKTTNLEYWSGDIPWIQSSDLVEGDVVHVNIKKFIDNNALKNSAAKLISRDSIALVTRVGVGKVAVINQDFTTSQDFLSLSDFDGNDIKFIAYQLFRLMQENAKVLQGTSIKGISKTDLIEQSIAIPNSIKEQNLIASLLSQTDSIITLHQRKLNNLKLKKKALLQKLFPKNGKRYPELRFPGFTDAWEQRKLDNIAKIKTGGGTPKTTNLEYWSGDIPWIQSSDLVEGDVVHVNIKKFIDNNALKNSAAKLISRDSIALVTRVGVGKVAVINQDFTTSQDFLSLSDFDGNDIKFIAYQLFRLMQENAKVLQGTSIKGISKTDLIEQSIAIPNSIKEQNLIASLLSQTDSIITLHQRKLDHLQLQKKALLQQMFV